MNTYTHPAFMDVYILVRTAFKIPTKDMIELKVYWIKRKHGYVIAEEKIRMSLSKWSEFKRMDNTQERSSLYEQ
jgi:predicted O-linked N-acetylglucosamine transferase (SPINDLY family)